MQKERKKAVQKGRGERKSDKRVDRGMREREIKKIKWKKERKVDGETEEVGTRRWREERRDWECGFKRNVTEAKRRREL